MSKPPTIEVLDRAQTDCQKTQDDRYKEVMKRIERLENKLIGALGIGVLLLLTQLASIAIALIKK